MTRLQRTWALVACGTLTACKAGCFNLGTSGDPPAGQLGGDGTVRTGGEDRDYTVIGEESYLYLLVRKSSGSSCVFFHHHAVAALGAAFTFALNRDNPAQSTLTAQVPTGGLDVDRPTYDDHWPDTRGERFTDAERQDIRANMLDQVDAAGHPTITFVAASLSTLDGDGTAEITMDLRGQRSTLLMDGNVRWDGDTVTFTGTGTIDGNAHGMPTGTFRDCIEASMALDMKLVMKPGRRGPVNLPDDGGVTGGHQQFPDTVPCGHVGYQTVEPVFLRYCASCHANPPTQGATIPLVTYDDFRHDTVMFPGQPIYLDVAARMLTTDGRRMPPAGWAAATQSELALVQLWVAEQAPQHQCDADGGVLPWVDAGPVIAPDSGPPPSCGTVGYADVAPVMAQHCTTCHRVNGTESNSPLDSYESGFAAATSPAYRPMNRWRAALARIMDHTMPPGGADVGMQTLPGNTQTNVQLMRAWVDNNLPRDKCLADGGVVGPPDAGSPQPNPPTCTTNRYWTAGDVGDPRMHPGGDCISCHTSNEPEPERTYSLAGTVMGGVGDVTDCAGIAGVTVHVTPAIGPAFDLQTNEYGNFFRLSSAGDVAGPYQVELRYQGRTRRMEQPQTDANCMACHTQRGESGAPGRILAP